MAGKELAKNKQQQVVIYGGEPAVEIDPKVYAQWQKAEEQVRAWKVIADDYREQLEAEIGNANLGLIDGIPAISYRATARYQTAGLKKDYPDLTSRFIRQQEVFDAEAFAAKFPDIAGRYQTRAFRKS